MKCENDIGNENVSLVLDQAENDLIGPHENLFVSVIACTPTLTRSLIFATNSLFSACKTEWARFFSRA